MSCFHSCSSFVMWTTSFFIIFCSSFLLISFQPTMAEEEINSWLYTLSTRKEMVQMAGYGEDKLSTVLVTGTVICEACFQGEDQLLAWPIAGALVTVYCHNSHRKTMTKTQAITDENGEFMIDLPSHLHAIPNMDKTCSVKVLRMAKNSLCRQAYVKKRKGLQLSSVGNGIRNYATGKIRFLYLTSKFLRACTDNGNIDNRLHGRLCKHGEH